MVAIRPFGIPCGRGKASTEIAGEMVHLPWEHRDFSPELFPCCLVTGARDSGQIKSCSFVLEPAPVPCKVSSCLVGLTGGGGTSAQRANAEEEGRGAGTCQEDCWAATGGTGERETAGCRERAGEEEGTGEDPGRKVRQYPFMY